MKARERKLKREREKNENTEKTEKSFQLSNLSNSNSESISNKTKIENESIISINQNSNINIPSKNNYERNINNNNNNNNNNNEIRKIKTFRKSNSINELHINNNISTPERGFIRDKKKNISGPITQFIDKQYRNIKRKKSRNNLNQYLEIPSDIQKETLLGSNSDSSNLEDEINKLSILYNLNISNEKMLLEENTEFFDMRNTIKELEKKIEESKKEYEYIVNQNTIRTINENEQIKKLEDKLKKKVNENIEIIRKDNKITIEDVNVLDKKLQNMNEVYQKEEYDLFQLIHEIEKTNKKLKMEIHFIDDLKERLKKIKGNEIPKDLKEKIDSILGK